MRKQSGFTLIELVIVVVILGFLAVTAIPKFLDLTDQAKQANIEGMAGGFATAISLARAQWEAEGRSKNTSNQNFVDYDGTTLYLTVEDKANNIRPGYVLGTTATATIGDVNCVQVWNNILQQPPKVSTDITDLDGVNAADYYVVKDSTNTNAPFCSYYLRETIARDGSGNYTATGIDNVANYFRYFPASSNVEITIKN
ncbi:prepilin-type N-terminal cleavage/methylation domain-containing protein [Thalassotalea sp. G2M2-11]|uniref:type II secretion system protein n=1 Tax=Thalassotalea sp. G2M2-11 TaxID=2787627 RepID=UPI0019D167BE|nr:prepilin-type N-terminal cleavage/methylation domain-containing protein [Thalassotalea sp. G2M2-11]